MVNEIPEFEEALSSFRQFLTDNGHPSEIVWVFRDDLWKRSVSEVFVRIPSQPKSVILARKVFNEGRKKGLVDVHAVAVAGNTVAATVWFPRTDDDEIQGWNRGMKLTISEPLLRAKPFGSFRWWLFSFLPRFRHYQTWERIIGTKAWAAA
jgi:hypothetical protein